MIEETRLFQLAPNDKFLYRGVNYEVQEIEYKDRIFRAKIKNVEALVYDNVKVQVESNNHILK